MQTLGIFSTILFVVVMALMIFIFPKVWDSFTFDNRKLYIWLFPAMIGYFILHEVLHAISYMLHGGKWNKITFGAELEKGVFYCLCKQDITRKNILISTMYPLFFIGILTLIIGTIYKLPLLSFLSIANISGAAGDIMYFMFISKLPKSVMFSKLDDGTSFAILSDRDISKVKAFGLEFDGAVDSIPREDFKKIRISKLSYVVGIICIALFVAGFIV